MKGAFEKAGRLHRDVTPGNIVICPTVTNGEDGHLHVVWKGLLTDWELSKLLGERESCEGTEHPIVVVREQLPPARGLAHPAGSVHTAVRLRVQARNP